MLIKSYILESKITRNEEIREIPPHILKKAKQYNIFFPSIEPLFKSPPDENGKKLFVEAHKSKYFPEYAQLAKIFVDNINYIPHQEFLTTFLTQLELFIEKIGNKPYVLWISQNNKQYYNGITEGCSELWLAGLAFQYSKLPWPVSIETTDSLGRFLKINKDVHEVLVMDDAIYSGTHLEKELSNTLYEEIEYTNLSIVLAYSTKLGQAKVLNSAKQQFHSLELYSGGILPTFGEFITEELKKFTQVVDIQFLNKTLTYFDHAVPDFQSTHVLLDSLGTYKIFTSIYQHMFLLGYYNPSMEKEQIKSLTDYAKRNLDVLAICIENSEDWNLLCAAKIKKIDLVPPIFRPYRLHDVNTLEAFKNKYLNGALGIRTEHHPPENYDELCQFMNSNPSYLNKIKTGFFFDTATTKEFKEGQIEQYKFKKNTRDSFFDSPSTNNQESNPSFSDFSHLTPCTIL